MSASKQERFVVQVDDRTGILGFSIHDRSLYSLDNREPRMVDSYRSLKSAEQYCRLLNQGLATIDRHSCLGCRIIPLFSPETTTEMMKASWH